MDDWDWELLHDSKNPEAETEAKVENLQNSASSTSSLCDDCGVIHSDYFSLESHHKFAEQEEEESSDNPSWVDPSNISVAGRRERISCSNSDSSDPSDSRNLLLLIDPHSDCAIDYSENKWSDSAGNNNGIEMNETLLSGESHDPIDSENKVDSVENLSFNSQQEEQHERETEADQQLYAHSNATPVSEEEERGSGLFSESSNEEKKVVWWKVPLEVLKYCVLRVSPVWSLSMAAAAVMGFVILRRRYLYKMKRKTQGLQLKVTVDDKKVSQFMSRVARLNEAFSVVKRVPIIRPSLPAPGLAPWPMVSLR